jgi:hypothetical protein
MRKMEGNMSPEKILTTITSADPDSLLEVALCGRENGQTTIELRRLSWGEGIGWFRQQTLRLDTAEAESLLSALRTSRNQWKARPANPQARKVIPFPQLAGRQKENARKTA